jgi:predicted PurR-regulated permease PerM
MVLLAAFATVLMLQFAAAVLMPIALSLLLFYALDPIVDRVERWHVPRSLGATGAVLAVVAVGAVGGRLLWPQVSAVVEKIPRGAAQFRQELEDARRSPDSSPLGKVQEAADAIDTATAQATQPAATQPGVMRVEVQQPWRVSNWLWSGSVTALGLTGQGVTVLFLTIFLLYENDSFKRKLVSQMETLGSKRITVQVLNDIARQIERFLWVQVLTSTLVAVATGLSLWWLGVEQPAVWGLVAGVMNVIPYFGPLIVTIILAVVAFLQFGSLEQTALVTGVTLAITTVEGMWLTPHLISRAASLNHVAIFVALAFWSWAWGIPGMLLAVPLLMAMKAVCDHVAGLGPLGAFLGE